MLEERLQCYNMCDIILCISLGKCASAECSDTRSKLNGIHSDSKMKFIWYHLKKFINHARDQITATNKGVLEYKNLPLK